MIYKKFLLYFIPFIVSAFIMYISLDEALWSNFWRILNIPSQLPAFSDLDSISRALNGKIEGFNPYYENPYDISQKPYSYTSIWLYLFDFFKLNNPLNFKIFNFIIIYLHVFVFIKIVYQIENKYFSLVVGLFFFSTSNLLLLERLNIESIIFILVYFLSVSQSNLLRIPFFSFAFFLKLYPVFSVFVFMRNKKLFISMIISSLLAIFLLRNQIYLIMQNSIEYALIFVHGIPAMAKGIYYYSVKYDYFVNDDNYLIFKLLVMFLASIYALIIFSFSFKLNSKNIKKFMSIEESLFICGGGIFIGRMISFSNFDYGLIFLIFTIPYILKVNNYKLNFIYLISLIISSNSLYIEGGDRYTFNYFGKAFFVHSLKILIFSIICFYFGKIVNEHLKINFKKL